jgi:hypothetical protein
MPMAKARHQTFSRTPCDNPIKQGGDTGLRISSRPQRKEEVCMSEKDKMSTELQPADKLAELLERLRSVSLFDDDFMTKCFEDNVECTELILHIVLGKPDLSVVKVNTQYGIKNLQGRSGRLDIHATDSKGKKYNIEVERDKDQKTKKIRYNLSLMDANSLLPGDDMSLLPETYVIMIMETDFWGKGAPIYRVNRYIGDTGIVFDDGTHIIYVNGGYKDKALNVSALGKLIHDFNCSDPNDMYYSVLAERVRYLKKKEGGTKEMGVYQDFARDWAKEMAVEMAEEMAVEKAEKLAVEKAEKLAVEKAEKLAEEKVGEKNKKTVLKLLGIGKLTLDEVSECTGLSVGEIKELMEGR